MIFVLIYFNVVAIAVTGHSTFGSNSSRNENPYIRLIKICKKNVSVMLSCQMNVRVGMFLSSACNLRISASAHSGYKAIEFLEIYGEGTFLSSC